MGFREDLARKIEKKRSEISALEADVLTARTYLQALEDMYKLAGKGAVAGEQYGTPTFRPGTLLAGAYAAIKEAARPLHVNELLAAMGRTVNRAERSAVSGTLAAYVRRGDVFTRPAPNTFGIVEISEPDVAPTAATATPAPPTGFGRL